MKKKVLEIKMRGMETKWRRLREIARGAETVSRDLKRNSAYQEALQVISDFYRLMTTLHPLPPRGVNIFTFGVL